MESNEAVVSRSGILASRGVKSDILFIALFVGIMTIGAWIKIPGPIPVTLQTLAAFVTVGALGTKRGSIAVGSYLAIGLAGAPVFAGFAGGVPYLLGATGGYIIGFLFLAIVAGKIMDRFGKSVPAMIVAMIAGLAVCYLFGTVWFMVVSGTAFTGVGIQYVLGICVAPFLIPDAIKIALAIGILKLLGNFRKSDAQIQQ